MDNTLTIRIEDDGQGGTNLASGQPSPSTLPNTSAPAYPRPVLLPPPPVVPPGYTAPNIPPGMRAPTDTAEIRAAKDRIAELQGAIVSLAGTGPGAAKAVAEFRAEIAEFEKLIQSMRAGTGSGGAGRTGTGGATGIGANPPSGRPATGAGAGGATTAGPAATAGPTPRPAIPIVSPYAPTLRGPGRTTGIEGVEKRPDAPDVRLNQNIVGTLSDIFSRASTAGQSGAGVGGAGAKTNAVAQGAFDAAAGRAIGAGASAIGKLAGPVGLAQVAFEMVTGKIRGLGDAAQAAANSTKALARNDLIEAIKPSVEGVAVTLEKVQSLGVVGKVAGESLRSFMKGIDAARDTVRAFVDRGKELQQFDARIAIANARADIRSINADAREARRMGEALGKLTDAQSRFDTELRELMLPIKENLVEILAFLADNGADLLALLKGPIQEKIEGIRVILTVIERGVEMIPMGVGAGVKLLREANEKADEERRKREAQEAKGVLDALIGAAENLRTPATPDPNQIRFEQRANMPIFGN